MQSDRALKLHCPTAMWPRILIGVSGCGGVGKSTLCALLSATCNSLWGSTGNTSSDIVTLFMVSYKISQLSFLFYLLLPKPKH